MVQPHSVIGREQVVDTMIGLTRLSTLHRAIIAVGQTIRAETTIMGYHTRRIGSSLARSQPPATW